MFLLNAFSLQMVSASNYNVSVKEIETPSAEELKGMDSAIGHPDTAAVLGVQCNRISITLKHGDKAVVAQLQGGRLPEGATTLPEGFFFKFLEIRIE